MKEKTTLDTKAIVVLEAVKGKKTIAEISKEFDVDKIDIIIWKEQFLYNASSLFESEIDDKVNDIGLPDFYNWKYKG